MFNPNKENLYYIDAPGLYGLCQKTAWYNSKYNDANPEYRNLYNKKHYMSYIFLVVFNKIKQMIILK